MLLYFSWGKHDDKLKILQNELNFGTYNYCAPLKLGKKHIC